jgi:ribosomal protein S7
MLSKTIKMFRKAVIRRITPKPSNQRRLPKNFNSVVLHFQLEKANLLHKLFGYFVKKGKREVVHKIFLKLLFDLKFKNKNLNNYFYKVFSKPRPVFGFRPKRLGAAIYKLPFLLSEAKKNATVIKWIAQSIKMRTGLTLLKRVSTELDDIYAGRKSSLTIQKCSESTRLALYNRSKIKRNRKFRRWKVRTRRFRSKIISN